MNILEEIIINKKQELKASKSDGEKFKKIFQEKEASIIGEIKIASPKYDYSQDIDLEKVFHYYGTHTQIVAVSNLIDEKYFKGNIARGAEVKGQYDKPIFFKEFVVSKAQVDGAAYFGYDALLLLARVLTQKELKEFIFYTQSKNIFPIVEVDCEEDLEETLLLGESMNDSPSLRGRGLRGGFGIAINCRNLGTMEIERNRHFELYEKYKEPLKDTILFAFSGVDDIKQVEEYKGKYNGVLIGTYFMKQFLC